MRYVCLLIAASVSLSACATSQHWTRIDRSAVNETALAQATTICNLRSDADAKAAMAGPSRRLFGTSDAIASGISDGLKQSGLRADMMKACMAERGYIMAARNP